MKPEKYEPLSKFARLNLEKTQSSSELPDIEKIINEIKRINDKPLRRMTGNENFMISQRLLNPKSQTRTRNLPKKKPQRPARQIREVGRRREDNIELPSSAQYYPNYEATFKSPGQINMSQPPTPIKVNASNLTQAELMNVLIRGPRNLEFFVEKPKKLAVEPESETKKKIHETIGSAGKRDSFLGTWARDETPAPDLYQIPTQTFDKNRVIAFEGQSGRKDKPPEPDRTHFEKTRGIDFIKPRCKGIVPFGLQSSREKGKVKYVDVWDEFESEQKALLDILKPKEEEV